MKLKWIAPFALVASLSGAMYADTLNYTFTTSGSGSLDGTSFNFGGYGGPGVTFTMTANSANVVAVGNTFSITGPVTVSVPGVGTDTVTDTITIKDPSNQVFYLTDVTTGGAINTYSRNACFTCAPYDLLTGPYGPAVFEIFQYGITLNTAHGMLVVGQSKPLGSSDYATFQITEANVASTPEPSSFILLSSGALGLITMVRKRARAYPPSSVSIRS